MLAQLGRRSVQEPASLTDSRCWPAARRDRPSGEMPTVNRQLELASQNKSQFVVRALPQLIEEPRVLDGDDSLGGEILH